MIDKIDWTKNDLIPAIVQESENGKVLMLAYMNKEAVELTLSTNLAHFYSRSRKKMWKKGESSGNLQHVKEIYLDCDLDTILLKVKQDGGCACHTGRESCFFNRVDIDEAPSEIISQIDSYSTSDKLYHTIQERKLADPKTSYVASLFKKGENSILKKVVEEAGEFSFAVKDNDEKEIIYEAADLAFHTLVALAYKNVNPDLIKQELERRFGLSGIEEKNSRENT
ncbi:bifunctional phosphoribosyl-AMP cyclohydrolase/phosphoribosyl-ATP diphosphatase HisIE [Sulfurospirillum arcachonense]|uniref:bifunctional phosphoribosyl-AMP cyclohydrolase/phosphoribosyl-ATP diphosphatase HisIE n=1 Tax=Sulfurospirillum arcachonense TaxID=57666 RepID=UPI000468C1D5|nr:bifunctional phosphoribosyl-AMP cyclohydrolase/phosphoribosyl-ATP diphosphatase HisIE [Sulfurospirillum arcachonense]